MPDHPLEMNPQDLREVIGIGGDTEGAISDNSSSLDVDRIDFNASVSQSHADHTKKQQGSTVIPTLRALQKPNLLSQVKEADEEV